VLASTTHYSLGGGGRLSSRLHGHAGVPSVSRPTLLFHQPHKHLPHLTVCIHYTTLRILRYTIHGIRCAIYDRHPPSHLLPPLIIISAHYSYRWYRDRCTVIKRDSMALITRTTWSSNAAAAVQPNHARCLPSAVSLTQLYPIALSLGTTVGVMWTTGACKRGVRGGGGEKKRDSGETARGRG
jgi:hypothetical protein